MRARWLVVSLVWSVVLATPRAFAQSASVQAESLFDEGRKLLQAGKLAEACAAFESSQKLDPAITTLLNLADCREQNDQLATAWGTFVDANRMAREKNDKNSDKLAKVASNHARKLEPRLSKLTIAVPADHQVAGLEVLRGSVPVNPASWNHALPIDGGTYTITARAPGHAPWSATKTIKVESDAQTVEIPKLADAKPGPLPVAVARLGGTGGTPPATAPSAGSSGGVASSAKPNPGSAAGAPSVTAPFAIGPADSKDGAAPTPWSQGVSEAAQKRALQLFEEGNVFFEQAKYTEAVAKYEQALAAWDHPNIRFNMAFCLINMWQPLVAWEHLKQALRFGDAPLGESHYAEAMTYVAVLESSLAELTVKSTQPDVSVMVDGGQVLAGAGEHTMKLLAGKHKLVATRPGYVTDSRALDLDAGTPTIAQIALAPKKIKVERENYDRRWQWWLPWVVAGSSVAFGTVGGLVYADARSEIHQYDRELAQMCPAGCTEAQIPGSLKNRANSARHKSEVAIGLWTGAGAAAITGGVLAILNRSRKMEERRVVPALTVSRDYAGVGLSFALE